MSSYFKAGPNTWHVTDVDGWIGTITRGRSCGGCAASDPHPESACRGYHATVYLDGARQVANIPSSFREAVRWIQRPYNET